MVLMITFHYDTQIILDGLVQSQFMEILSTFCVFGMLTGTISTHK